MRRQQINASPTPYRRPVVTNNPGGGSVASPRPGASPSERSAEPAPNRPSRGTQPGTLAEPAPTRPNPPASRTAPQVPQSRQPEVQRPVRVPSHSEGRAELRAPEGRSHSDTRGGSDSRGGFEARPSQPAPQRSMPSAAPSAPRGGGSPSVRRP
ncbi:MAG: hypothetical protein FJX93_02045 [Bacteroidetes bacterium]|nr:hypothetical protein [Bacteroidota bacterium]